jgi:3-(3-hydroxy-phenyl)propionate hydroxylase
VPEHLTHHPFTPVADLGAVEPVAHRVVIVGAGSVGLTLALALARLGVASVVIERAGTVGPGSRALGMSRRTMEIWEALGCAPPMLDVGIRWTSGRSFFRGEVVADFAMPTDPAVRHAPMLNIAQSAVDEILVAELARTGLVELRWHTELVGLAAPADGPVRLELRTPDGPYAVTAEHVVACDGGRSTVRSLLGLRLDGTTFDSRYVIVDVALRSDHPAQRRAWFDPPSNPGSTVLMHRQPGDVWRLDYQLRPEDDLEAALAPATVEAKVAQHLAMIGETGPWRIEWVSSYRANSACLDRFQHDRVLFAGDSAHLIPIFGIRGLNSGVEDAWTLAWKLAATVTGTAGPALLASYSLERVAAARENMAAANRSTRVMTPDSPGLELLRDATLSLAITETQVRDILNPRQGAPTAARTSPLNTADAPGSFSFGPEPGQGVPDVAVRVVAAGGVVETHLLALLDPARFTLLVIGGDLPEGVDELPGPPTVVRIAPAPSPAPAPGGGPVVVDPDGDVAARFDAPPSATYLVRPDHLVCARWRSPRIVDLRAALARATGTAGEGPVADGAPVEPELSRAEQRYRSLARGVDAAGPEARLFLAKVALLVGLRVEDDQDFDELVEVALRHLGPVADQERRP